MELSWKKVEHLSWKRWCPCSRNSFAMTFLFFFVLELDTQHQCPPGFLFSVLHRGTAQTHPTHSQVQAATDTGIKWKVWNARGYVQTSCPCSLLGEQTQGEEGGRILGGIWGRISGILVQTPKEVREVTAWKWLCLSIHSPSQVTNQMKINITESPRSGLGWQGP